MNAPVRRAMRGVHRRMRLKWERPSLFTRLGPSRLIIFSPPFQVASHQFTGSKLVAVPSPSLNCSCGFGPLPWPTWRPKMFLIRSSDIICA